MMRMRTVSFVVYFLLKGGDVASAEIEGFSCVVDIRQDGYCWLYSR